MPGTKVESSLTATKTKPQEVTVDLDTSKADVGDVAKAIGGAKTPHANLVKPATAVVVPVQGLTKNDTAKVRKALADVKGVVAPESTAADGQAIVQLDPGGGAHLADIRKALKKAGG